MMEQLMYIDNPKYHSLLLEPCFKTNKMVCRFVANNEL